MNLIVSSSAAEMDGFISWTLANLPDATEFTTLFDQYRIVHVDMEFMPTFNQNVPATSTGYLPIVTAIDYDDSTTATYAQLGEYESAQYNVPEQRFVRSVVPAIAIAAYSGVFTSFANRRMQWLDCASPSVVHYGLKWAIPQTAATVTYYQVLSRLTVQFKQSR